MQKFLYLVALFVLAFHPTPDLMAAEGTEPIPDFMIAVGGSHACQVHLNGTVTCWGNNKFGQLGNETKEASEKPVTVQGIKSAIGVSAGKWHTCAVLKNGEVKCWGKNNMMQLGMAKGSLSLSPVTVPIGPARQVAAGRTHTCARLIDGSVYCWGDTVDGQLGVQASPRKRTLMPVKVPGMTGATFVTAGAEHACAVLSDGQVFCWGDNHYGQLGHGIKMHQFFPPKPVPLSGKAVAVAAGRWHSCALLVGGTVQCWGDNYAGQVGDGKRKDVLTPVDVKMPGEGGGMDPLKDVKILSAGWQHSCALNVSGKVYCWGDNNLGQLGEGIAEIAVYPSLTKMPDSISVAAGGVYTCALKNDHSVRCVGQVNSNPD